MYGRSGVIDDIVMELINGTEEDGKQPSPFSVPFPAPPSIPAYCRRHAIFLLEADKLKFSD
jgi:hypothetical protein